jgi:hypothetical protein
MRWEDSVYDRAAGDEHEKRVEAARRRNEDLDRVENERAAKARVESERRTRHNNAVMQLREYQRAGVRPPSVDGDGYPTVSLETLFHTGWTIEPSDRGECVLVRPKGMSR